MRQWWTLPELAERSLPCLPATRRGMMGLADREAWRDAKRLDGEPLARKRAGRGGGFEFHISLLPIAAQAALVDAPVERREETVPDLEIETATDARTRDARLAVLALAQSFRATTGMVQKDADIAFAAAYSAGSIVADAAVRAMVPSVSRSTLCCWRAAVRSGDGSKLASRQGRTKGTSPLMTVNDGAVATYIGALLIKNPFYTATHIRDAIEAKFGPALETEDGVVLPLPSARTFCRFVSTFRAEHKVALTKIQDPDAFKSRHRIAGLSRHTHVERVNQTWQIDASPADVLCLDGRNSIYVLIDVFSRRIITYVSRTPRAQAVKLLLRKAILAWGVPDLIETDNGSDFTAKAVQVFLSSTGIEVHRCDAYSPEQKGIVERCIGTMHRYCGTMMPGFIGHSVADRKQIEARRAFAQRLGCDDAKAFCVELTAMEMADYLDRWAADHYANKEHTGLGKGITPFAKAASHTGRLRRVESERALDVLLMDIADGGGVRTVGKQGIRIDGGFFIAPTIMVGEKVLVRLDPGDLGKAYCFSPDGAAFLGEAINPELLGIDRASAVAMARAKQNAMIDDSMKAAKAEARKIKPRDVIDSILRMAATKAGKLVEFPKAHDAHDTPQLTAASQIGRRGRMPEAKLTGEQEAKHAAMVAEFEADASPSIPSNIVKLPKPAPRADAVDEKKARYRRYLDLASADASGEPVAEDERHFLATYPTTSEFRALTDSIQHFGVDAVLGSLPVRAAN
jgi:putative transposase